MTKFVISIIGYPRQLAEMKSNFWSTSCHRILRIKASEVIKSVCASHIGQKWENSAINTSGCMITSKAKINAVWNIFNHSTGLLEVTLISSQFIFLTLILAFEANSAASPNCTFFRFQPTVAPQLYTALAFLKNN